ncbi:hypothetical protein BO221_19935 [Archangium sp. Cb G35]|uniref:hypothetical protein n=1 Tax=Archangium sp. Cb G35 TaxID=1920190 RepID=UPI000936FB92|nr:hypothetical protein [Archangium sp. Cb G35]OJT23145.1 hypothetical protein BO221_19935 [Archangium sp. Cb G35]
MAVQVLTHPSRSFDRNGPFTTVASVASAAAQFPAANDPIYGAARTYYNANTQAVNTILNGWIGGGYLELVPKVGSMAKKLHTRQYANYGDLLKAAVFEHRSRPSIAIENRLASEANNSAEIEQGLAGALLAVYNRVMGLGTYRRTRILNELRTFSGAYWLYYRRTRFGIGIASYIQNPNPAWVTTNIAIYHDLMEFFLSKYERDGTPRKHFPKKTAGQGLIREEEQYEFGSFQYTDLRGQTVTVNIKLGDDYRNTLSTPNESVEVTQSARDKDMLMWASHSWTTLRLMQLVKWASGNNLDHYEAVAWALFAFWNRTMLQGIHPIHRFHEVMDIAKNFGVYYREFTYPDHAPGHDPNRPYSNWYSRFM